MNKAVFLDRDGIINKKPKPHDYVKKWPEFEFIPGVERLIKKAKEKGYLVIVVTNQRGIARGLMTEKDLEEIHQKMQEELKKKRAKIDAVYYCPHNVEDNCNCRKPKPGLILKAAKEWDISLERSIAIGDSEIDAQAASRAGCGIIVTVDFAKKRAFYLRLTDKLIEINTE